MNSLQSTIQLLGTAELSALAGREENSAFHYGPLVTLQHACAPLLLCKPLTASALFTFVYLHNK